MINENESDSNYDDSNAGLIADEKLKNLIETGNNRQNSTMGIFDWLQSVVSAVVIGIFVFIFFGRMIGVEMTSMLPTLHERDRVVMSNLFYTPQNGDIVIFRAEPFGETPLVKRVIAVGGQTIDIDFDTGDVTVDGAVLDEPYINTPTNRSHDFEGPLTIPEGHIFVMGDNRNASIDSRSAGIWTVDARNVLGKVLFVLVPGIGPDKERDWSRLGKVYNNE